MYVLHVHLHVCITCRCMYYMYMYIYVLHVHVHVCITCTCTCIYYMYMQVYSKIEQCLSTAQESISDLDLFVMEHKDFGKGAMKKCGVSPDAFIQSALQLAHFRVCVQLISTCIKGTSLCDSHCTTSYIRQSTCKCCMLIYQYTCKQWVGCGFVTIYSNQSYCF